jgi:putative membrane protein
MIRKIAAGGVVALALLSAAPMAMAESSPPATAENKPTKADQTFITKAVQGNLAEVKMGQLGQDKAESAEVKAFGQMLVADHGAAAEKSTSVAQTVGVIPPSAPNATQQKTYDSLAKLSGDKFDRQYMQDMVKDHKTDIAAYTKAAQGTGPVADYAKATLPTLQKHLQHAQAIVKAESSKKRSDK